MMNFMHDFNDYNLRLNSDFITQIDDAYYFSSK